MFNYPGIRHLTVSIVYHGVPLIVGGIFHNCLERHRAVLQLAEPIVVELIKGTSVNKLVGNLLPGCPGIVRIASSAEFSEEITLQPHISPFKQPFNQPGISSDWYSLVFVVEIVVVKYHAHR